MTRKSSAISFVFIISMLAWVAFSPNPARGQIRIEANTFQGTGSWNVFASPVTDNLNGISMVSPTDGWAVGDNGTIIRWDSQTWQSGNSPTTTNLLAIDMVSASDGWAVGEDGLILHWNGANWAQVQSPVVFYLDAVQMLSSTDGWIVGQGGTFLHWNGSSWSKASADYIPHIQDVDLLSPTVGWAVGQDVNIEILQWNGIKWSSVSAPLIVERLLCVDMLTAADGWAGGTNGLMLHWNGISWIEVTLPTDARIEGLQMLSVSDGWAVGQYGQILHWDGVSWTLAESPLPYGWLSDLELLSENEGWAVGADGTILHYLVPPALSVNYPTGAPGSFFTIQGNNFPALSSFLISVNNHSLGTVYSDASGSFTMILNTTQAEPGYYMISAAWDRRVSIHFILDSTEPVRSQEGAGFLFDIPSGIALTRLLFLPLTIR